MLLIHGGEAGWSFQCDLSQYLRQEMMSFGLYIHGARTWSMQDIDGCIMSDPFCEVIEAPITGELINGSIFLSTVSLSNHIHTRQILLVQRMWLQCASWSVVSSPGSHLSATALPPSLVSILILTYRSPKFSKSCNSYPWLPPLEK